jgi:hypothetical protein
MARLAEFNDRGETACVALPALTNQRRGLWNIAAHLRLFL